MYFDICSPGFDKSKTHSYSLLTPLPGTYPSTIVSDSYVPTSTKNCSTTSTQPSIVKNSFLQKNTVTCLPQLLRKARDAWLCIEQHDASRRRRRCRSDRLGYIQ